MCDVSRFSESLSDPASDYEPQPTDFQVSPPREHFGSLRKRSILQLLHWPLVIDTNQKMRQNDTLAYSATSS